MVKHAALSRARAVPEQGDDPSVADGRHLPDPAVVAVPGLIDGLTPLRRQAATDTLGGTDVPGAITDELRRRRGGGEALPGAIAGPLAEHFGTDLSDVRVHADAGAGVLARSMDAAAFTHGNDIYFAPEAYRPGSPDGQRVLAHELSHVAAQRSGADRGGSGSLSIGRADDPAEAAADRSADRAMSALRRSPTGAGSASVGSASAGPGVEEATGLEIRRWRWPWESKSKSKDSKDKGSQDSKSSKSSKGSKSKGSKSKDSKTKGSKSKGSKGSEAKSSSQPTLPSTAPTITEDVKDTGPTTPQAPPQPTVTTVEDTKSESESTETETTQPTVTEDSKDGGSIPQAPPQPTVTTGEDTKSESTETETEQPTITEDVKDTAPSTQPVVEAPAITYPRVFTIGQERIQVASAEQEVEADQILSDLKDKYGLDLSSTTTISAIKKDYKGVPKKVTSKLKASVWSMQELRALQEAAVYYAPILGSQRENSSLKGTVQGVTTVGKVKNAIDQGGKKGKLDDSTVGEYFSSSKNLALFDAGTNYEDKDYVREGKDKTDVQTSLSATAVHEMAHALVEPTQLTSWVSTFEYWADEDTKSGKTGAERPPSSYGRTSAAEDLCESVSMYFINRPQLKKLCPGRDAFVDKVVKGWKPEQKAQAVDTAVNAPESETPPSESEAKD